MVSKIIRSPLWIAFRLLSRTYLTLSRREYRYVYVLGHMRSGSTLLAHILANHSDFAGAGEMHISYRTAADLKCLVLKTCEFLHRPILRKKYIIDQINHDYLTNEVLNSEKLHKCIILLRKPEATLKSMMKLSVWQEKDALEYYVKRLQTLTRYGLLLRERAMLVEYDDLIDHTDQTLSALTRFLGLDTPLTPNYATHRMTGRVAGYGDPSSNIKTGRIIRTPNYQLKISEDTLTAATRVFHKCRVQLQAATARCVPHD